MTKDQIKAELRRSAREDVNPYFIKSDEAFRAAKKFCSPGEYPCNLGEDCRTSSYW